MLKNPKQLPNCPKSPELSVVLIVFDDVLCEVCTYTIKPFLTVAQHESGTRRAISWSVTVYNNRTSLN
jgi:hypothetical protein